MMPVKTSRNWASSQPISTPSSSASWASSRSSARFSLSTLIFSTHDTGSPSGVCQTGNLSTKVLAIDASRILFLRRRFVRGRLRRVAFAGLLGGRREHHLSDQVLDADRGLGELDPSTRRQILIRAARHQRHVFVAKQSRRNDLGDGVVGE